LVDNSEEDISTMPADVVAIFPVLSVVLVAELVTKAPSTGFASMPEYSLIDANE
jgi:hypothetical protein